jgi:hypothetical protein
MIRPTLFPAIDKVPARGLERLLVFLGENEVSGLPEVESEAVQNWLRRTLQNLHLPE